MMARVVQVPGERLSEFLGEPRGELIRVEVTSQPSSWPAMKPALTRFMRDARASGAETLRFSGVPLCLFGSEWAGFRSTERSTPALGRCIECQARDACGFAEEVPDELFPISRAPLQHRWREYRTELERTTGIDNTDASDSILEKIVAAYPGSVSLEPSLLVSDGVEPCVRFVVFPHRVGVGEAARAQYEASLECAGAILADLGSNRCAELLSALGRLPPSAVPLGLDGRGDAWSLKMYLRLENKSPAEKQDVLEALSKYAPGMHSVSVPEMQMVGLVLDDRGLRTVKAYVSARPSRRGGPAFPPPLAPEHPLIGMSGDSALATLDVWCRGTARTNKWDFNLREHYLAGEAAERLVAQIGSPRSAGCLRSLLVGSTYRADIVAVGLRGETLALYMELN